MEQYKNDQDELLATNLIETINQGGVFIPDNQKNIFTENLREAVEHINQTCPPQNGPVPSELMYLTALDIIERVCPDQWNRAAETYSALQPE